MEEYKETSESQLTVKAIMKPRVDSNMNLRVTHPTMQSTIPTVNRATLETQAREKNKFFEEQLSSDSSASYTDENSSPLLASDQEADTSFSTIPAFNSCLLDIAIEIDGEVYDLYKNRLLTYEEAEHIYFALEKRVKDRYVELQYNDV